MFRKFRDQPWYLFRYMLVWALVLGALSALLWSPPPSTAAGWLLALTIALIISTRFDAMLAALIPAVALSPEPGATLLWLVLLSGWWLYAVINYYTHPPGVDGRNHAVDLCTRPWHRLVNRVGCGVLYHAAHHGNARLFNPSPASSAG